MALEGTIDPHRASPTARCSSSSGHRRSGAGGAMRSVYAHKSCYAGVARQSLAVSTSSGQVVPRNMLRGSREGSARYVYKKILKKGPYCWKRKVAHPSTGRKVEGAGRDIDSRSSSRLVLLAVFRIPSSVLRPHLLQVHHQHPRRLQQL
jgi:hypothetical protein